MDLTKIKSAVLNQLTNTNGLYSLKLQNHIYGCFVIMEDIAQNTVDVSGTILSTNTYKFDVDKQFDEIGLRYGFAMDTKLKLDVFDPEYKATWLEYFGDVDLEQDIGKVDSIEDCIIELIEGNVNPDEAFFKNALESGTLSTEWVNKVIELLNPRRITPTVPPPSPNDSDEDISKTSLNKALSEAKTEKNLSRAKRRLAVTRRAGVRHGTPCARKKILCKTRRIHRHN